MISKLSQKKHLGPVVQSILSLTGLLRGQLVKCFTTLLPNTMIFFFVEKIGDALFQQKKLAYLRYLSLKF